MNTNTKNGIGGLPGISSGFASLDKITGGWQNSDLIILASRPSVGKTAFAHRIALNAALNNVPVAIFSIEMSSVQFVKRILISEQLADLSDVPLFVDDTPALKVNEFCEKAKKLVEEEGVRLFVIDYLQLMCGPEELQGKREEEVSFIIQTLKSVAKKLDVAIIALSQLSRIPGRGIDARPELRQLYQFEAVEKVADTVILIYRPHYNMNNNEDFHLIVAKNRNGKLGEAILYFLRDKLCFTENGEMDERIKTN